MPNIIDTHFARIIIVTYNNPFKLKDINSHLVLGFSSCFLCQGLGGLRLLHLLSGSQEPSLRLRATPLASLALRCSDLK